MKIEIEAGERRSILARDMSVGMVGEVINSVEYEGALLVRHYSGFVNLRNPQKTWGPACDLHVVPLAAGTVLKLTIED